MENSNVKEGVHGYKVFRSDWTCCPDSVPKQYTCPGKFEEEGELNVYSHGMHFCVNAADCFNYYGFDSNNKVAEVIAYGTVLKEGKQSCTDKLEIVREIPWDEVLRIVNTGKNCTGCCNTGDCNAGNRNTGNWNTGDRNTGNRNTGNWNTGDRNAGNCNTGNWNTGNYNAGDCNAGNRNTGNWNTGNWNTGDCNAGNCNTGNWNTGNCNAGNRNTGDWNKSSYNTGCFMTEEQKIMLFNRPSDWTYNDWLYSDARYLLNQIPRNVIEWVYSKNMTDEEKAEHPTYETTGGYLKVINESESGQLWWGGLTDMEKNIIKSIPNFDPEIFEQCTGIKIEDAIMKPMSFGDYIQEIIDLAKAIILRMTS